MCSSKATTGLVPGSGNTVSILKYSIATLLLCASSVVAGIHTYLAISAILSAAAVPVLFAAISVVAALVALSSTVYLIKSFVSAVNSEREIDPSEKKPGYQQPSELEGNEECKHKVLEKQQQNNSNANVNAAETPLVTEVPTPGETVSSLPSDAAPPPPPQLPQGAPPPPPPPPPSGSQNSSTRPCNANLLAGIRNRSTELKKPNISDIPKGDARDAVINSIRGTNVKTVMSEEQRRKRDKKIEQSRKKLEETIENKDKQQRLSNTASQDMASILARRVAIEPSDSESASGRSDHSDSEDWTNNEGDKQKSSASFNRDSDRSVDGKEPRKKKLKKRSERSTPQTHQPDNKKRSESPDSGCASDDDVQSKPTSPLHFSAPKTGKPQVLPKPTNLQTRPKAPPETKVDGGVDTSGVSFKKARSMFS